MPDGTGLYHELWKEVFTANGVKPVFTYAPYKRCQTLVERGEADAIPGGYGTEGSSFVYSNWHIGIDILSIAYPAGTLEKWSGQPDMEGKTVGWQRGYEFDKAGIVTANVKVEEFDDLNNAIQKLAIKRLDFLVDYADGIAAAAAKHSLTEKIILEPDVIDGPKYFMSFTNNAKGEAFVVHWDKEMQRLDEQGKLKELYAAINDPGY